MPEDPRISDFLNGLSEDPETELLFEKEPVAIMTKFGLSEAQQLLILEGSPGEIRAAIKEEIDSDSDSATLLFIIRIKK